MTGFMDAYRCGACERLSMVPAWDQDNGNYMKCSFKECGHCDKPKDIEAIKAHYNKDKSAMPDITAPTATSGTIHLPTPGTGPKVKAELKVVPSTPPATEAPPEPSEANKRAQALLDELNRVGNADSINPAIAMLLCGYMIGIKNSDEAKAKRKRMVRALKKVTENLSGSANGYRWGLGSKGALDSYDYMRPEPVEPKDPAKDPKDATVVLEVSEKDRELYDKAMITFRTEKAKWEEDYKSWYIKRLRKVAQVMIDVYEGED